MQVIPMQTGAPRFRLRTSLAGQQVRIELRWFPLVAAWFVDTKTQRGDSLARWRKVRPRSLILPRVLAGFDGNLIVAISEEGVLFDDAAWGKGYQLLYVTSTEAASLE